MKTDYLKEFLLFVLLILTQVLLLNRISLFGIATPVLYIYFLLKLPMGRSPYYVIISGFLLGLIIDIFLNTPGMNATATTIIATFRKPILLLFYGRDIHDEYVPSIHADASPFIRYTIFIVLIHISLLFFIESFTLFNLMNTLIRIAVSFVISTPIILALDSLTFRKKPGEQA